MKTFSYTKLREIKKLSQNKIKQISKRGKDKVWKRIEKVFWVLVWGNLISIFFKQFLQYERIITRKQSAKTPI